MEAASEVAESESAPAVVWEPGAVWVAESAWGLDSAQEPDSAQAAELDFRQLTEYPAPERLVAVGAGRSDCRRTRRS